VIAGVVTCTVTKLIELGALDALANRVPLAVLKEVDRERVVRVALARVAPKERLEHARVDRERLDASHLLRPRNDPRVGP
jgi:hypothetical protein